MKSKLYIAWFLCAVYLFAQAAVAVGSITCRCGLSKHIPAVVTEHACCAHCQQVRDGIEPAGCGVQAPCHCGWHLADSELYTGGHADESRRWLRCAVDALPAMVVAVVPRPALTPAASFGEDRRAVPLVIRHRLPVMGPRAPSVPV